MEKRPFFWAAIAGLGKYHTGGYDRIGVYKVKVGQGSCSLHMNLSFCFYIISSSQFSLVSELTIMVLIIITLE